MKIIMASAIQMTIFSTSSILTVARPVIELCRARRPKHVANHSFISAQPRSGFPNPPGRSPRGRARAASASSWSQPFLRSTPEILLERFSRSPSGALSSFRLNVSGALGLKGTNGETLEGSFSCTGRTTASNRTMKISASIAATPWIKTGEHGRRVRYFLHNPVISSTCSAIWSALRPERQFLARGRAHSDRPAASADLLAHYSCQKKCADVGHGGFLWSRDNGIATSVPPKADC